MKKTLLQILCAVSFTLLAAGVDAQVVGPGPGGPCNGTITVNNTSGDDWTVSYYNVDYPSPAGTNITYGFTNANISAGRGVLWDGNLNGCNHKFQTNPEFWFAACAPNTSNVIYFANETSPGCFSSGVIVIQP